MQYTSKLGVVLSWISLVKILEAGNTSNGFLALAWLHSSIRWHSWAMCQNNNHQGLPSISICLLLIMKTIGPFGSLFSTQKGSNSACSFVKFLYKLSRPGAELVPFFMKTWKHVLYQRGGQVKQTIGLAGSKLFTGLGSGSAGSQVNFFHLIVQLNSSKQEMLKDWAGRLRIIKVFYTAGAGTHLWSYLVG